MNRLRITACACFVLSIASSSLPAQEKSPRKSYVYKTVGELKIEADVYRYSDQTDRPVIVWLHGGALMMGSRSSVPKQLQELCEKNSYVLVSLDYRLVPQAKLPEIIADLKDGLNWIHKSGPKLFGAGDAKCLWQARLPVDISP